MKTSSVITIGRQFGSGGRYVGKLLAEKLEIPYYDKEILTMAAKESGICEEMFESQDEKPTKSLLFSLVTGLSMHGEPSNSLYMDMPLNHKIFLAQFDTIKRIASQGPCVIVGRCADYVLRDHDNTLSLFLYGSMESRIDRLIHRYNIPQEKAKDSLVKMDKQRSGYYNYYATGRWGDIDNYDLCLDTGAVGVEGAVDVIITFLHSMETFRAAKK